MIKSNNPADFPIFSPLSETHIKQGLSLINKYLQNLAGILNTDVSKITAAESILHKIIEQVEKRRIYFHIFHEACKMGELNEGSLYCFWIIKLHPFHHPAIDPASLNAKIAICLLTNTIYYHANMLGKSVKISPQIFQDIYYSFRYRDISKEAIMLLAESYIN